MDILIIVGVIFLIVILSYTAIKYFIFNSKLKEKIDILITDCEYLIDTEHYDDVIKYCEDFLSENIEFKKYRLICFSKIYIARAYYHKNNFQETIKITTDIIKQGKSDYIQFSAYSFRALSYIQTEDKIKAINDLSKCVDLRQYAIDRQEYRDVLLLYYLRGSLRFSLEEYNLAISNFTNYLSLYNKYKHQIEEDKNELIEILLQRARSFLEINSLNEAINDCSKIITMDNENEYAYFIRAISFLNLIDDNKKQDKEMFFNNALEDLETVLTINPDNTEAKKIYEAITENQEEDFDWKELGLDFLKDFAKGFAKGVLVEAGKDILSDIFN